jgi:hypothetical protein
MLSGLRSSTIRSRGLIPKRAILAERLSFSRYILLIPLLSANVDNRLKLNTPYAQLDLSHEHLGINIAKVDLND